MSRITSFTSVAVALVLAGSIGVASGQVFVSGDDVESFPLAGAVYESLPFVISTPSGDFQVQSMKHKHRGHVTVLKASDPVGTDYQVDSFFDITYQIAPPDSDFQVDSFFDIAYRIGMTKKEAEPRHKIKAVDRASPYIHPGVASPGGGDPPIIEGTIVDFEHTFEDSGGDWQVDSFFDIEYRISFDGGNTWSGPTDPVRSEMTQVPEPASIALIGIGGLLLMRRRA